MSVNASRSYSIRPPPPLESAPSARQTCSAPWPVRWLTPAICQSRQAACMPIQTEPQSADRVDGRGSCRRLGAGRSWVHTMTDPDGGIAAAEHLFAEQPLVSLRQVIDVSGDGRQNTGEVATADARDAAVSHGLTVNGLPIASGEEPGIEDWY